MNKATIFALVVLCCVFTAAMALVGQPSRRFTITDAIVRDSQLAPTNLKGRATPEQWYANLQDHYDPLNHNTYNQRFWVNSEFYSAATPYTPIYITLCCEGECSPKWVEQGLLYEWAKKTGGLLVSIEHRYYGKSQPAEDWSYRNLRFLTMEQALADAAYFIRQYLVPNYNPKQNHPIVVAGGSYGGTMAASMRHNYPNLVHYAVAASGVYDPRFALPEFLESVIDAYEYYGGKKCVQNIGDAHKALEATFMSTKQADMDYLATNFPLCSAPTVGGADADAFFSLLTDSYIQVVQYNKESGPGFTVKKMCDMFEQASSTLDKLQVLGTVHKKYVLGEGNCYRWKFAEQVEDIGDIQYKPDQPSRNMRQWYWQTLTQFGWYQAPTPRAAAVFGYAYPIEYFVKLFIASYDPIFTRDFIEKNILRTISTYNQYTWRQSNVLFTAGQFDPWKTLHTGINYNDAKHGITTYMVNNTSHCAPLYQPQSYDPLALQVVRDQMYQDLQRVLNDFPRVQFNNERQLP
jgi:pimeloyl-ACP methyl ester carboxylesterase